MRTLTKLTQTSATVLILLCLALSAQANNPSPSDTTQLVVSMSSLHPDHNGLVFCDLDSSAVSAEINPNPAAVNERIFLRIRDVDIKQKFDVVVTDMSDVVIKSLQVYPNKHGNVEMMLTNYVKLTAGQYQLKLGKEGQQHIELLIIE